MDSGFRPIADVIFILELHVVPFGQCVILDFQVENEISDWAKSAVHRLARCGIVTGKGNSRYDAHSGATRAELVSILNRVNNLK